MKINLYQVNALTDPDKAQVVLEHGTNLKTRKEEGFIVNLYSLSDFYVELWYDEESNRIDRIRSFKNIDQLEPYIDDIDLGDFSKLENFITIHKFISCIQLSPKTTNPYGLTAPGSSTTFLNGI